MTLISKYPSWNTELKNVQFINKKKVSDENGFKTENLLESEKSQFLGNNSTNFENIENQRTKADLQIFFASGFLNKILKSQISHAKINSK